MYIDSSVVHDLAPTGSLRVALNMANPMLARSHTVPEHPAGVTIDLARELAAQLGVAPSFQLLYTPGLCLQALAEGRADVGFLAVDPHRAKHVRFTAPYVQIEGCYLAHDASLLRCRDEIDRPGMQVIVIETSAYDLFLTRELRNAGLVRLPDADQVTQALRVSSVRTVAAGLKQSLLADLKRHPELRLLQGAFMEIKQAMALRPNLSQASLDAVQNYLAEQIRGGFIAASLRRHGIDGAEVATPREPG